MAAIVAQHPPAPAALNPLVPAILEGLSCGCWRRTAPAAIGGGGRFRARGAGQPRRGRSGLGRGVAHRTTVGREAERQLLRDAFLQAAAGESCFITVTGEPGMGKTVLVEDFLAEIEVGPYRPVIARGRSSERLAGSEAYLPVLEALEGLMHPASGESFSS